MRISQRLYVTVAPAVLGIFVIAALAYWGRYARQAPELFIVIAAVAGVVSLVVAWSNARFIAERIERLAGASESAKGRLGPTQEFSVVGVGEPGGTSGPLRDVVSAVAPRHGGRAMDEIDAIEHAVDRLSKAVNVAESDRALGEHQLEERVRDHARLLAAVVDDATHKIEEARLPLHILLENHFGDLNENQEEMLGSARAAVEAIDTELVSLRRIAEFDLGQRELRLERVRVSEIIDAIRPLLMAAAESEGATLRIAVAPLLPAVSVDRVQLQESLATLIRLAIAGAGSGAELDLGVDAVGGDSLVSSRRATEIEIVMRGGVDPKRTIHSALAVRIVSAHGGTVTKEAGLLRVTLPASANVT